MSTKKSAVKKPTSPSPEPEKHQVWGKHITSQRAGGEITNYSGSFHQMRRTNEADYSNDQGIRWHSSRSSTVLEYFPQG